MPGLFRSLIAAMSGALLLFVFTFTAHATANLPLVDANWLKNNLDTPDLVILDIRSPSARGNPFLNGHIKGARFAPYNKGWREKRDGVIGMLPLEERIEAHIRSLGVNNSSHVIIVPHGNSSTDFGAATRVYWTFKVLGHQSVSILDGGYKAWALAQGALSREVSAFNAGDFDGEINESLRASQSEVQISLRGNVALIDARPRAQYEGRAKSPVVPKAGTIPGGKNLRQSLLYNASEGRFASRNEIEKFASEAAFSTADSAITFCNTGHWASLAWFALYEIKGNKEVALYDGSMAEWTRNDGNPVVPGDK